MDQKPLTSTPTVKKKPVVNDAVAAKLEKSAGGVEAPSQDFTIHITEAGDTFRTVERVCQGNTTILPLGNST